MKRESIILGGIAIILLLFASCLFPTDQSLDAAEADSSHASSAAHQDEEAEAASGSISEETRAEEDWFAAGTYTVGDELPPGSYVIQQLPDAPVGYIRVTRDGKKSILENNFENCFFVALETGQSISFSGAALKQAEGFQMKVDLDELAPGMYRVGTDIPAGAYQITENENQPLSSYAIYVSDSAKRSEREKNYVMTEASVEVRDGELLELIGCTAKKQ